VGQTRKSGNAIATSDLPPDLAVLVEPLLIVRRVLREQIVTLHRRLLAIVPMCAVSSSRSRRRPPISGSNTAIRTAFPGASVYSMTKGAIASLVRGIAIDLAPRGITVNNVQPGPTETDMTAAYAEMVKPLVPLGRLGKPEEIAGLVAYLASPEAGFITGSSQTIDGGYVA
jgi:NAD(P)-dependent dehydrogenase (short-subunit alcohol dehydrogenase family)